MGVMAPPWPWFPNTLQGDPRRDAGNTKTAGNARRDAGMQGRMDAGMQGRRDAGTQGCRDAGMQGRRDAA